MTQPLSEIQLREYYRNYFPFQSIRSWINYGGKEPLDQRECAFWYDSERFNRWANIDDMDRIIHNPHLSPPERMEIGPVYSLPLKDRTLSMEGTFYPLHRELVFDIDADDFKDIKCCCGDSEICEHCWHYMHCALVCLTKALRENFGFKHILPVFSGRRGVHLWVCDRVARELAPEIRKKIVAYLNLNEIVKGNFKPPYRGQVSFPFAEQMKPICEQFFVRIADEQSIFTNEKIKPRVIECVGSNNYQSIMDAFSEVRGNSFKKQWEYIKTRKFGPNSFENTASYYRLIFAFTFPRLDENVTTVINHLLKSPFSFHPKSGLLSLPIPDSLFGTYPPEWVPKLRDLLDKKDDAIKAFKEAVDIFEKFREGTLSETD